MCLARDTNQFSFITAHIRCHCFTLALELSELSRNGIRRVFIELMNEKCEQIGLRIDCERLAMVGSGVW